MPKIGTNGYMTSLRLRSTNPPNQVGMTSLIDHQSLQDRNASSEEHRCGTGRGPSNA
jgi:hypothetical protein